MDKRFKLASLFLISLVLICFELYIMRVFSIGSWTNFGSLIISTALLGFGLSGTLLTFLSGSVRKNPRMWLLVPSALTIPAMAMAHLLAQIVPLNPVFIGTDPNQLLYIGLYYVIYGVPFFLFATYIGAAFIVLSTHIHRIYFWNMLGSGLGGLVVIIFMYFLPTDSLIIPILALAFFGVLMNLVESSPDGSRLEVPTVSFAAVSGVTVLSLVLLCLWGSIHVSEFKAISYVRKYPDAQLVHHSYSPAGEFHVYASSSFHFAPGQSDNAAMNLKKMPAQPFWGLYIDGSGPIGIMGKLQPDEAAFLDYLPMSAPYLLISNPDVLLVNLGGGISAQVAQHNKAASIQIVEQSAELVDLMRNDAVIKRFTGDLLSQPNISTEIADPRAWASANPQSRDIVEISLIDSIGLSDSGGYAVQENYTYTVEAIKEYLSALKPNGILSITVWNRLNPPRNVPRLLATIVEALRDLGIEQPQNRVVAFDLFLSTATILVKNGDFNESELREIERFAKRCSFEIAWRPGLEPRGKDINTLLDAWRSHFTGAGTAVSAQFTPNDFYHLALTELFAGRGEKLFERYIFDIRPMRDSRPYYSGFVKFGELPMYLDQLPDISEEWGYLLILGIFLQSIVFGLIVILVPVIGSWKDLFRSRKGTLRIILYYAGLGMGYMLIEIFLIQRLGVFLSNPTYSTSIVITSMLILSALGNLFSGRFANKRSTVVMIAGIAAAVITVLYIFLLDPMLEPFRSAPFILRILICVLVSAPLAFVMGVPFPNGLSSLDSSRPRLLPWAWGLNGGLSVTGAAVARLVTVSWGFPVLLAGAALIYLGVAFLYKANEIGEVN